jgi:lysophospholipase L1-like esterase
MSQTVFQPPVEWYRICASPLVDCKLGRDIMKKLIQYLCFGLLLISVESAAKDKPLRILPLGDSITAGYTDNPVWDHPFKFGYRSGLYRRLVQANYSFVFVGQSPEPFNRRFGDPAKGHEFELDLRQLGQDGHRGYGGWRIPQLQKQVTKWMQVDQPDIVLLMVGINGISADSPKQLDALLEKLFSHNKLLKVIVAQITPKRAFNQDLFDYNTYIRQTLVPTYQAQGFALSTVDMYKHFLTEQTDPRTIDASRLSNGINHPTNAIYDELAQSWFDEIERLLVCHPNSK